MDKRKMQLNWQWLIVEGYEYWLDTGEIKNLPLPPEITYPDLKLNYAMHDFLEDLAYYGYTDWVNPHDQSILIYPEMLFLPSEDYMERVSPSIDRSKIVLLNLIKKEMKRFTDCYCNGDEHISETHNYEDLWDIFFRDDDAYFMPDDLGEAFEECWWVADKLTDFADSLDLYLTYDSVSFTMTIKVDEEE